jgi:hypothetical protein
VGGWGGVGWGGGEGVKGAYRGGAARRRRAKKNAAGGMLPKITKFHARCHLGTKNNEVAHQISKSLQKGRSWFNSPRNNRNTWFVVII